MMFSFFHIFNLLIVGVLLLRWAPLAWAFSSSSPSSLLFKRRPGWVLERNNRWQTTTTTTTTTIKKDPSLLILEVASSSDSSKSSSNSKRQQQQRKPSRVTDDDGPTPDLEFRELEEIDDIPELREIEHPSQMPPGPIPHQPWRRGMTDGCEDPISAEWRVQAEDIIAKAATLVGGNVLDVTWYLTAVVITLDSDLSAARDVLPSSGPVVHVRSPREPVYYDPDDPKPEPIWADEEEIVYQRETEEEAQERKERKHNMYVKPDESDPEGEPHIPEGQDDSDEVSLYMNEETRMDAAYTEAKAFKDEWTDEEKPVRGIGIDTQALSSIAGAIIEALEDVEDELRILSRHQLVLASPGPSSILETQKEFNANRGKRVIVETQDPWQSNRVLKGTLLDRNSMDVYINKKGRMVTIPLNFVKCVRLVPVDDEQPEESEEEDLEEAVDDSDLAP